MKTQQSNPHFVHTIASYRNTQQNIAKMAVMASLIVLISMVASLDVGAANPTNKDPKVPLESLGAMPVADAKIKELYALFDSHEKLILQLHKQKNPSRVPVTKLAKSYGDLWKKMREAEHLKLMGEPAGGDLQKKLRMMQHEIYEFTSAGAAYKPKVIQKLRKQTPARQRELEKAAKMISAGQNAQAVKALENLGTNVQADLFYLSRSEAQPFWNPIGTLLAQVDPKVNKERAESYRSKLMPISAAKRDAVKRLASEAERLPVEIQASGTAKLTEDQSGDAVAAVEYLGELWAKASAELVNHAGVFWGLNPRSVSLDQTRLPVYDELQQSEKVAIGGIEKTIRAAAISTASEDVAPLYSRMLKALSVLDRRMSGRASEKCKPALDALVAKNPSLASQIEKYERATAEALRWRREFAQQKETHFLRGYPEAGAKLRNKEVIEQSNKPEIYGPVSRRERTIAPSSLSQPAEWMVFEAGHVVGKTVAESNVLRLSKEAPYGRGTHNVGHYSNVKLNIPVSNEIRDLMNALVLSPDHGPLSITAADAISSATLMDYELVGGQVARIHLESFVSTFGTLPAAEHMTVQLNSLPQWETNVPFLDQTCWKLDILPHWVRHRYFLAGTPQPVK